MTYGELPDLIGGAPSHNSQPALYCRMKCEGGYSANRGDYFLCPQDQEIICAECGQPMELLVARVTLEPWSPPG